MTQIRSTTPFIRRFTLALVLGALVAWCAAAAPAAAQCTRHLAYVDLITGGTVDTTGRNANNPGALEILGTNASGLVVDKTSATGCTRPDWFKAVVRVDLPPGCQRVVVWLDYVGTPAGWTAHVTDSETGDGFGGDAGSLPVGQNAEVQVLDELLTVWNAADNPTDVEPLLQQHLALTEGALRFTVSDQRLTIGQPTTIVETPDLERLFFLPTSPTGAENRVIWVGLNRAVNRTSRDGCGLSKALVMFE
jgi:hypothetical protein